jgi:tetratricopeptide (TPR) repeat protein
LKLNILDSAEKYLDKSINAMISKNGKDWVHFNERFYKGICSYKQKKIQNALQEFDETLRLNSNFSDAQYYKALVLLELHKKEGCLDLLQKAKENNEKGFTINEDNESYVDYPFQIKLKEINDLIESVRK